MSSSRLRFDLRIAEDTAYLQPEVQVNAEVTDTPTAFRVWNETAVAGGTDINPTASEFTAIQGLYVQNTGGTNALTVGWDPASAPADVIISVPAGDVLVVSDVDVTGDITITSASGTTYKAIIWGTL